MRETEEKERKEKLFKRRKLIFRSIFTFIVIIMHLALIASYFAFEAKQAALLNQKKAEQEAAKAHKANQQLKATIVKQHSTIDSLTKLLNDKAYSTKKTRNMAR